jgi:Phage portal protein
MNFLQRLGLQKVEKSITLNPFAAVPAQIIFRQYGASPILYYAENTDTYLEKGFEGNHVVFTIADWIAKKMTLAPPILYNTKDKSAAKDYKYLQKEGSIESINHSIRIKNRAFKEVESHKILEVLKKPNPLMTWDEFVYGYFIFKSFVGNALIQGVSTDNGLNKGKIQELYLLPSNYFQAVSGGGLNIIDYYQDSRNPAIKVPTEQILAIRNFSSNYRTAGGQLSGMSVMKAAAKLLKQSNEGVDAQAEAFQNRGASKLVFPAMMPEGGVSLPDGVTIDAANEELRKRVKEAGNKGLVLNSVPMSSLDLGNSPIELGILDSQKYTSQQWASLFHVDSRIILNDHESSTKDNMQTAQLYSLVDGVFPHLSALANGLNDWLLPSYEEGLFLDFDYTTYSEMQRQLRETAKDMKEAEIFTVNEIRAMWKYGEYSGENGDKILVGSSKQILDDISNTLLDTTVQAGY